MSDTKMFWWIRKHFAKKHPEIKIKYNDLNYIRTIEHCDGYSAATDHIVLDDIQKMVTKYRNDSTDNYAFVTTNYNGKLYPFFDFIIFLSFQICVFNLNFIVF